jgi:DNA-directed RNA polymerase specialized sigma24 family protein
VHGSARHPIAAALAARDEVAFVSLLAEHYGPMLRLAKAISSDDQAAVAGVRRAWESALRTDDPANGFPSLASWLFALVQLEVERDRSADDGDPAPDLDADSFKPEEDRWAGHWSSDPVAWGEHAPALAGVIQEHLRELPSLHAAMVVLHDAERLSSLEITAALGLTSDSQLAVLHSARMMLRNALDRHVPPKVSPA